MDSKICKFGDNVFLLEHSYEDSSWNEHTKTIGIYSNEIQAEAAIDRLRHQPGFIDYQDNFVISRHLLNQDSWVDGFFTEMSFEVYTCVITFLSKTIVTQYRMKRFRDVVKALFSDINKNTELLFEADNANFSTELFIELPEYVNVWEGKLKSQNDILISMQIVKTVS